MVVARRTATPGARRFTASFGGPAIFLINKYLVFEHLVHKDPGTETYLIVPTSIAATCVLWILVSLLTRPDPEEVLVAFYRRAKPMGFWGPIATRHPPPACRNHSVR